jgi:hypothetical protein
MSSPSSRWYLLLFTQSLEKSRDLMHPVGVEIIWLDEHLPANFCYLRKRNLFRGNNSLFVSLSNSLLLYIFSCCSISFPVALYLFLLLYIFSCCSISFSLSIMTSALPENLRQLCSGAQKLGSSIQLLQQGYSPH